MDRSRNVQRDLLPEHSAVQHGAAREHAPRPLPLFLELVRQVSERDPALARDALAGLRAYESAGRALLLEWGKADERAELDVVGHVEHLLLPLLRSIGEPAALIGYCLGGTMAIAAANLVAAERVVTLAAPWAFARYPERSRAALEDMWRNAEPAARRLGALPMEVLQAAFWSLDPERTVRKFAGFGRLDCGSA